MQLSIDYWFGEVQTVLIKEKFYNGFIVMVKSDLSQTYMVFMGKKRKLSNDWI